MPNARIPWGGCQTTRRPAYGAALHDHGLRFLQGFALGLAAETFPRTEPPNTGFRTKRAQRGTFLDKTDRVMPWTALQALIEPRDMTTLKFRCLLERPGARLRPRPSPPRAGPGRPTRHAICRCTTPRQGKQWHRHEGPYWRGRCQWPGACSDGHIGERRQHDGSGPFGRSLSKRSGVAQPAEGEDKGPVRTEAGCAPGWRARFG